MGRQFPEIMKPKINCRRETITKKIMEKKINELKKKKSENRLGWKGE